MLLNFGVDTFWVICLQVLIDQTIFITRKHFFEIWIDKFSRTHKNSYLVDGQLGASDFKISTEVRKIPVYTSDSLVDINYEVSSMGFHLDFSWQSNVSTYCYRRVRNQATDPGLNALFARTKLN